MSSTEFKKHKYKPQSKYGFGKTTIKETKNPILSMPSFSLEYKNKLPIYTDRGGTAVYNHDMNKILLVQGIVSNRWGFPKGMRDKLTEETNLNTAIRETKEEIGFVINLVVPILPSIVVDDATIYGISIPESTLFEPEEKEIIDLGWFSIDHLYKLIKDKPDTFTKMLKSFIKGTKNDQLKNKMSIFSQNYILIDGKFNQAIKTILDAVDVKEKNPAMNLYNKYYLIKTKYPNVFSDMEIISMLKLL